MARRRARALVSIAATLSLLILPGGTLTSASPAPAAPVAPAAVTPASAAAASAAATTDTAYRNATSGAQCDASVTLAALRSDGTQQRIVVTSPLNGPVASLGARTSSTAGLTDFQIVDEGKLAVGLVKRSTGYAVASFVYNSTGGRWVYKAQLASGVPSSGKLIAQGRGVVYVILNDGSMRFYQVAADGSRITIAGAMSTAGWASVRKVTGTGNGSIFVLNDAGEIRQWTKDRPFLASGTVRYRGVVATRPDVVSIAGSGDGVLWGVTKTGGLVRMAQYSAGRPLAVRAVSGASGLTGVTAFTADPNACGDGETQIRLQIAASAKKWAGTGDAFCDSYDCNPRGWWCQDFAWAAWFTRGVEYTSRFRTDRYQKDARPNVVNDPYTYAAAYKMPVKKDFRNAKVGDIVIWDPQVFNGKTYVGHNAVITRVYYTNGVPNGYFDFMHGNYSQSVVFQPKQWWNTAHTLGDPDGFVSPRL